MPPDPPYNGVQDLLPAVQPLHPTLAAPHFLSTTYQRHTNHKDASQPTSLPTSRPILTRIYWNNCQCHTAFPFTARFGLQTTESSDCPTLPFELAPLGEQNLRQQDFPPTIQVHKAGAAPGAT